MARQGFQFTKLGTTGESTGLGVTFATFRSAGTDGGTALATAIGVLVADGATQTQAHVNAGWPLKPRSRSRLINADLWIMSPLLEVDQSPRKLKIY